MPVKFDAEEFESALRQVKQPKPAPAALAKAPAPRPAEERTQSEEFKLRIITARAKLKLMRDRSDALRDSLQRFREQQGTAKRA
ncbi:MAG: hypothetical protein WC000_13470 [Dokdonella sp.]|jgi:hypothetical protein|nr:MAG: hypothetical protein BGP25_12875 [Xanthomonadales bacterium 63-13]